MSAFSSLIIYCEPAALLARWIFGTWWNPKYSESGIRAVGVVREGLQQLLMVASILLARILAILNQQVNFAFYFPLAVQNPAEQGWQSHHEATVGNQT